MSHNKFSFITKDTFPSDPYIPYRLREIDLSYNEIPVLTYDFAFGTHKVKFLNLSHNSINEIRRSKYYSFIHVTSTKCFSLSSHSIFSVFFFFFSFQDVLSNLTQLETLDLSYNDLQSLESDGHNFTFPENLTRLYISNNKITHFPADTFDNLTTVKLIDAQNNSIQEFDLDLLKSIRNGLDLYVAGMDGHHIFIYYLIFF